jgi:hypothetical protein
MHGYEVTNSGLHKWSKKVFQKLGWMVLLKNKLKDPKINEELKGHIRHKLIGYQNELEDLHKSIEDKINSLEEEDRIADAKIELEKIFVLKTFFMNHMLTNQMGGCSDPKKIKRPC